MHVRWSTRLTWVVAGAGFFWLLILFTLTMADYMSRGWIAGNAPVEQSASDRESERRASHGAPFAVCASADRRIARHSPNAPAPKLSGAHLVE